MNDQEMQQRFLGTACERAMLQTVECYENNVVLKPCEGLFDQLTNCMKQNNLISILDPQFEDHKELYDLPLPERKIVNQHVAPGARQLGI
jgi:hypothetical protein